MNTKFTYPCIKCSHSEIIDFLKPPEFCSNCGAIIPPLQIPNEISSPASKFKEDTIDETEEVVDN